MYHCLSCRGWLPLLPKLGAISFVAFAPSGPMHLAKPSALDTYIDLPDPPTSRTNTRAWVSRPLLCTRRLKGLTSCLASTEEINLNAPHRPTEKAIEAFNVVLHDIKADIVKWRHHWDRHEPKMWARAAGLTDHQLVDFTIENDLVEVRSAPTSYGTIILGKIRLPAVQDEEGAGFVHVRCVAVALDDVLRLRLMFVAQDSRSAEPSTYPEFRVSEKYALTLHPFHRVPKMCDSIQYGPTKATAMPMAILRHGVRFRLKARRSSSLTSRWFVSVLLLAQLASGRSITDYNVMNSRRCFAWEHLLQS